MLLHLAARPKLVEGALGHPGEDVDHGVESVLLIPLGKCDHFQPKREEGTVKKSVHKKHLA